MVYTNDGLTLVYDTPDAPAPQGEQAPDIDTSVTVIFKPFCPSNAVAVHYRINRGPVQTLRAVSCQTDFSQNAQYFRATFPKLALGQLVDYGITGYCAGRRVPDPMVASKLPNSFRIGELKEASTTQPRYSVEDESQGSVFPLNQISYEFLAGFTITIEPPRIVGSTPDGIRVTWNAATGSVAGPKLRGKVLQGDDWMQIRPDGIANLNVHALLETAEGVRIMMTYSGIIELGEEGYQNFLSNNVPKRLRVWTTPRFLAGDPKYKWLNRLQCVSIGEVSLKELTYAYDVHALKLK
ncbi:MAG: DUF3237 domain-containing protein [Nitrospirales bacterium]|nr:DUF3237 domain-containing protein [Nitrospira sp.]MDR4460788.1 DUF3237 domain-containing protein [Nitrospirales bacterium]MDR4484849.1 DUF3237 domain-containing protein [Nitrospirales bacterium]